jgi:hypothetical protein
MTRNHLIILKSPIIEANDEVLAHFKAKPELKYSCQFGNDKGDRNAALHRSIELQILQVFDEYSLSKITTKSIYSFFVPDEPATKELAISQLVEAMDFIIESHKALIKDSYLSKYEVDYEKMKKDIMQHFKDDTDLQSQIAYN